MEREGGRRHAGGDLKGIWDSIRESHPSIKNVVVGYRADVLLPKVYMYGQIGC